MTLQISSLYSKNLNRKSAPFYVLESPIEKREKYDPTAPYDFLQSNTFGGKCVANSKSLSLDSAMTSDTEFNIA